MDVAFTVNKNGKLTFARNSAGDFYFDNRAVYSVFSTLFAQKGRYFFDSTVGTYLSTVTKDGRTTATRLVACANDALSQLRDTERVITDFSTPNATRLRSGAWSLALSWSTPSGDIHETLKV